MSDPGLRVCSKRLLVSFIPLLAFMLALAVPAQQRAAAAPSLSVGRDLTVGGNIILGMTKAETEDLLNAILKNEYREKVIQIAAESKLSEAAIKEIFRTVVGRDAGGITVQEQVVVILRGWVELKSRLEGINSDDAAVADLRNRALAALNTGNRAEAERLLLEAKGRALAAAKAAQDVADKRLRDAAVSAADLAQLSITNLRYQEAAQRYYEAAGIEPNTNVEVKCGHFVNAVDAALEAGDDDAADKFAKEAIEFVQRYPGVQFAAVQARVRHRLGKIALARGANQSASELLAGALRLGQLSPNGSKIDQADILTDLAVTFWNESKFKQAHESLQAAVQLVGQDESPTALAVRSEALNTEGGLLADMGDFAAAEASFLAGIDLRRKLFAGQPLSPRIIDSQNNLGFLYRQWGRSADADRNLKDAESAAQLVYGDQHVTMSIIFVNRAILACNSGELDLALELINKAHGIREKKLGEQSLLRAFSLEVKGTILLLMKRQIDEARSSITASYKIRSASLREPDLTLAKSRLALSALHLADQNAKEARTEAEAALAMLLRIVGPDHPLAGLAFRRLSEASRVLNDEPKAKEYQEKAAQIKFPTSECDL